MKKEKLMIIDGSSLLYRAFYALPLLSTKDGIYTNGIYGFLTMLYKVKEERNPDKICVVFDKKGPTFRHEEYDQYKANRSKTPSELVEQFPIIRETLDAMNIKYLEMSGFEADDIAGSLAKIGEKGHQVTLVTGDKDYLQLVGENTRVLITRKGITDLVEYDNNKILEEYGITPKQLIDLKGLMGDSSDNIPGVPGIGEKTGLKLLKEYPSIDNIYENIDKISGKKLKENLVENKELAYLSKRLGTIITNLPLDIEVDDLKIQEANREELLNIYKKLEFNSLINKIGQGEASENLKEAMEYSFIDESGYQALIEEIKRARKFSFKFVVENNNYIKDQVLFIGIKTRDKDTKIIGLENLDSFTKEFRKVFEDESIEKISHDLKGDLIILFRLGIDFKKMVFDSMIGGYLLNPTDSSFSINNISNLYLGYTGPDEESLLGKGKNKKTYKDLSQEEIGDYLSFILDSVFDLEEKLIETIKDQEMLDLYYDIELPLVEVLASMEYYGFKIDEKELIRLGSEYDIEIGDLTRQIHELAGEDFNINSPKQLGLILFDNLSLPVIKKTKTGYSTDAEVLDKLKDQHPIVEKVLRYRQIVKLKSTYIDGLLNLTDKTTHRVHSSFNQTITSTGRISSTEPNLQNIPIRTEDGRKIRKAFVAEKDYTLIDGDYSQIELRVLAHISEDPKLMEAFIKNENIHRKTASEVFDIDFDDVSDDMRSSAKAVNFGIIYGISDYGLSRDLNISRKEAKEYIDNYLDNYEKVRGYMEDIVTFGKEKGFVETIFHRRRYVPELSAKNFNIRSFGERIAMNTPIQGSAADIIKVAMVKVYKELKRKNLKSRLILQVHDELIIESYSEEVEEVKDLMQTIMEESVKLRVPVLVDLEVGESWYDTK